MPCSKSRVGGGYVYKLLCDVNLNCDADSCANFQVRGGVPQSNFKELVCDVNYVGL